MPQVEPRHPMAVALEWVSRITAIAIEMILPGILGNYLDRRFGLSFLAVIGFGLGVTVGIMHLVVIARAENRCSRSGTNREN